MTPELSAALIKRCQDEHGATVIANFALDMLLDSANAEIARLLAAGKAKDELNAGLMNRVRFAEELLEELKRANDPHRAEVMGAADKVRKLQVDRINGSDSDK